MQLTEMLKEAVEKGASDIFIVSGLPLAYKINNGIHAYNGICRIILIIG